VDQWSRERKKMRTERTYGCGPIIQEKKPCFKNPIWGEKEKNDEKKLRQEETGFSLRYASIPRGKIVRNTRQSKQKKEMTNIRAGKKKKENIT